MTWQTAWQLVRDIMLTGTGLALIIAQGFAQHPSEVLIVAGLALITPAGVSHAATVVMSSGSHIQPGGPPSSSPSSPGGPPPLPSSAPSGASGE